jgi:PPP family 3-phenylpropionic acid transporter
VLKSKGMTEGSIGNIMMISSATVMLFQIVWAMLCSSKITMKNILVVLIAISIIFVIPLYSKSSKFTVGFLVICLGASYVSLTSLINAWTVNRITCGDNINFSASRGIGSLTYAFYSLLLGVVIDRIGIQVLPYIFILQLLILLLTVYYSKKDIHKKEISKTDNILKIKKIIKNKDLVAFYIVISFSFIPFGVNGSFYPLLSYEIDKSTTIVGAGFFVMAISESFVMLKINKFRKVNKVKLLIFGMSVMGVKNILLGISTNAYSLVLYQLLQSISTGLVFPLAVLYIDEISSHETTVLAQSIYSALSIGLGSMLGSLLGSLISDTLGLHSAFVISGVIALIAAFVYGIYSIKILSTQKSKNSIKVGEK